MPLQTMHQSLFLVIVPHRCQLLVLPKVGARNNDEDVEVRQQRVCRRCLYCMRCVCCRPWLVCCCCCCCCCRPQRRTPRCTPAEELSGQSAGAGVQRFLDASGQGIELRRSPRGQRPLLSHSLPHCAVQLAAHLELQVGGQAGRQVEADKDGWGLRMEDCSISWLPEMLHPATPLAPPAVHTPPPT